MNDGISKKLADVVSSFIFGRGSIVYPSRVIGDAKVCRKVFAQSARAGVLGLYAENSKLVMRGQALMKDETAAAGMSCICKVTGGMPGAERSRSSVQSHALLGDSGSIGMQMCIDISWILLKGVLMARLSVPIEMVSRKIEGAIRRSCGTRFSIDFRRVFVC